MNSLEYLKAYKRVSAIESIYQKMILILLLIGIVLSAAGIYIYGNAAGYMLSFAVFDSNVPAEEILELGRENKIDLINVAIKARCMNELGLQGVPEWCARDQILPTEEDIEKNI